MISFKDIELQDKELITSYTQNSPRRNCDLSFSNLCSWHRRIPPAEILGKRRTGVHDADR